VSVRRAFVACATLFVLAACSSTFRFDEHSIPRGDGGSEARRDVEPPSDTADARPACPSGACGFSGAPCSGRGCQLECPYFGNCSGSCGELCNADCEEDSSCMLTAAERASLKCEERARCSLVVGGGSRVECERNSDCGVRCLGACTLRCEAGAVCSLACGPSAPLAKFDGDATCP
jgi:hypothetical protein